DPPWRVARRGARDDRHRDLHGRRPVLRLWRRGARGLRPARRGIDCSRGSEAAQVLDLERQLAAADELDAVGHHGDVVVEAAVRDRDRALAVVYPRLVVLARLGVAPELAPGRD